MDVFDLVATIRLNIDEFERGLDSAKKKADSFAKNVSGLSSNIEKAYSGVKDVLTPAVDGFKAVESVGKKAGNAVIAGVKGFAAAATAVGGFGAAAVQSGMAFDATMSEVSAISGATGEDFDALRNKALEMGAKTKFSASEAAAAMKYMGMAGWKSGDMIGGIEGIMNLAAASGEDLASTSDIVTDALTAFGKSAGYAGLLADIMAATATNANTDVGMMGDTFRYVAPVAGALGYEMEDTALAIGLMANSGIKATQAGTSLRSILTRLSTDAGASSKKLGALGVLTEQLGVQFYRTDGSARALYDVLIDSQIAWEGLSEEQQISYAKTIAGQEAMSGWLALMNAAPEDVAKLSDAIYDCNGAAEEMSKIMIDNLQGDLTILGSAFESLQIAISDSLTPTLREFAQFGQKAMAGLLEGFQSGGVSGFMDALSGIITDGVKMLAEKAPDFILVGKFLIFSVLEGFLGAKDEIFNAANTIMIDLTSALYSIPMHYGEELREVGTGIIELVAKGFSRAGDAISAYIGDFVPLIAQGFLTYHETLFTVGLDILGAIGRGIIDNKSEIQRIASDTITNMVLAIRENAPAIIEGGIALINALAGAIIENLPLIMETGAEIITQLILGINTSLPALAVAVGAIIPYIAKIIGIISDVGGAVNDTVELVRDGIGNVMEIGGKLMEGIKLLFGLIMDHPIIAIIVGIIAAVTLLWTHCEAFRDAVKAVCEAIVNFFKSAWESIVKLWEGAGKFFSGIAEAIQNAFKGIVGFFEKVFSDAWNAVKKAWNGTRTFFEEKWEDISGAFKGAKDKFIEIGGNIVDGLKNGIKEKWENFKGFLGTKVGGIIDSAKSKLGIHSPSKVFAGIGENMALGLAEGWGSEYDNIKRQIERGLSFGTATINTETSGLSYGNAATTRPGNFQPLTIIVKPILNEKVIGEASYKYMLDRERAYGGRW